MGRETHEGPDESTPKLYDADEWTYGDPLAPEAHDPELGSRGPRRGRSRIAGVLARIEQLTGLRIGRASTPP